MSPDFASPVTLSGQVVTLAPMTSEHIAPLFAATPRETFRYFLSWPREWTLEEFSRYMMVSIQNPKARAFAVIQNATGAVVGTSSYIDLDPGNRSLEIGFTWYVPGCRGTAVNSASKLLLLENAIERVGCERVTLKCDSRNAHSRAAIAAIGGTFEGILRKHRILQDGYVRDTAYFSVIREEWPRVKEHLRARIAARAGSGA